MFPMSSSSSSAVALLFSLCLVLLSLSAEAAFNITQFLNRSPEFTIFNNYLIQAGLVDQINALQSVTVLVVANDNMTALSGRSPDAMKKLLSTHVVLGYYDTRTFQGLPDGRLPLPTLDREGNLTAYSLGRNSPVAFGDDPNHNSILLKSLLSRPNDASVLQVSNVIRLTSNSSSSSSPPPTNPPTLAPFNITESITFPDLSTFSSYLAQTGIADQIYKISSQQAITVLFVGNDNMTALSGQPLDAIKKVLSVHVILGYYDVDNLKALPEGSNVLPTLSQKRGQGGKLTVYSLGRNSPVAFGDAPNHNSILLETIHKHLNATSVLQVSNIINLSSNSTSPVKAPVPSPSRNAPVKAPVPSPSSNAPKKAPVQSPSSNAAPVKSSAASPSPSSNSTAPSSSSPGASPPKKAALAPGPSKESSSSPRASPPRKALAPSPSKKSPAASSPNSSSSPNAATTSADTPSETAADGPGSGKSSSVSVTCGYHLVSILMVFTSPLFLLTMI